MASLVPLADAKLALYIPATATAEIDARVTLFLAQSESFILARLADRADPTWTAATLPPRIAAAILKHLGASYADVDGQQEADGLARVMPAIDNLIRTDFDEAIA